VYNSLDRRDGEEKEGKVYLNDREGMERYFSQFDVPSEVAVEASGSWYWFVDMLQKNGVKVHLSNPKQTKAIAWAKVKNNKVDARMLRKLLESNLLPGEMVRRDSFRHRTDRDVQVSKRICKLL